MLFHFGSAAQLAHQFQIVTVQICIKMLGQGDIFEFPMQVLTFIQYTAKNQDRRQDSDRNHDIGQRELFTCAA